MTPAMHALFGLIREDARPVCQDGLDIIAEYITSVERKLEILTLLVSGDNPDQASPPNPEKAVARSLADGRTETSNIVSIDPNRDRYSWRVEGAAS